MKPLLLSLLSTLGVVLGLVGLGVLGVGLRKMGQAARSRRWPTAPGTILSSTLARRTVPAVRRDGEDEDAAAARPPTTLYRPQVEYTYTVGARTFTGTRLGLVDLEVSSESHARAHAERYAPGTPVSVHYDPEQPERAVLEPGVGAVSWVLPGVGAVFLLVAGALALFVRWYSGR